MSILQSRFGPVAVVLLAAIVVRTLLWIPDTTPDSERFFQQAQWIIEGRGFLDPMTGAPSLSLPPGYPVLLAAIGLMTGTGEDAWKGGAWFANALLSVATCVLVLGGLRREVPRVAFLAGMLMAIAPLHARLAGMLLSETFSTFLVCLMIAISVRFERDRGGARLAFLGGMVSVASLMTAPAVVFLAFFLWCRIAWLSRSSLRGLVYLCLGSLLLMIPWQLHCLKAEGRVVPTVFQKYDHFVDSGYWLWTRTWIRDEHDYQIHWFPERFHDVPDSVFESAQQREDLKQALFNNIDARNRPDITAAGLDRPFRDAAQARIEESRLRFYVWLPSVRAFTLWLDWSEHTWSRGVRQIDRIEPLKRALERYPGYRPVLETAAGVTGIALFNAVHVVLLVVLARACLQKATIVPHLILAAALAYTLIASFMAAGEMRRNVPFYPAMLAAPAFVRLSQNSRRSTLNSQ